jgi:diguanylate cyclase (GGDEF)-like protein
MDMSSLYKFLIYKLLYGANWIGWFRLFIWLMCLGTILLLGAFRSATDAQYAIFSLALFPVLIIAWLGGKKNGLIMAFLATTMWIFADFASGKQFSAPWIIWANAATHLLTYALVVILASQVHQQINKLHRYATHDVLTGLSNRRAFLEAGAFEVERSRRYSRPLTFVFMDLDDFKRLNDTRGHDAGDEALQATTRALLRAMRSTDLVARLGGDEFAFLLPEIGYDEAIEAGHKIFLAVNDALKKFSPVTASIGVAWFGEVDRTFAEMLKASDELMYEVKASGKNNIIFRNITAINKTEPE